jgi:DNA-binding NarL/FixJ family response regulator
MKTLNDNNSGGKINLGILTKYKLSHSALKLLIENKSKSINVTGLIQSYEELSKMVSTNKLDIVLLNLVEDEVDNIDIIPKLFQISPKIKIILLSPPGSIIDFKKLLTMGIAGIVECDQREEVLIQAIQHVAEGGIWLNQKLMAQLLNNDPISKENGFKQIGLFANDLLTKREIDVVEEIAKGFSNKEIAKNLNISEATVRHHLSSVYGKLQLDDRLNLVIYAFREGIVDFSSK